MEGRRSGFGGALGIVEKRNNGRLTVCSLGARSFHAAHQQYNLSRRKEYEKMVKKRRLIRLALGLACANGVSNEGYREYK